MAPRKAPSTGMSSMAPTQSPISTAYSPIVKNAMAQPITPMMPHRTSCAFRYRTRVSSTASRSSTTWPRTVSGMIRQSRTHDPLPVYEQVDGDYEHEEQVQEGTEHAEYTPDEPERPAQDNAHRRHVALDETQERPPVDRRYPFPHVRKLTGSFQGHWKPRSQRSPGSRSRPAPAGRPG